MSKLTEAIARIMLIMLTSAAQATPAPVQAGAPTTAAASAARATAAPAPTLVQAGTPTATARAGLGRTPLAAEIAAWDIDVRPDWQGLPPGSGSVAQGQQVWDTQCASCHGTFGESNQVFTPIIGGTTKADSVSGHVAALANNSQPQRTTMMKLATLSTMWDYIRRAMPWNAPKSLSNDQVYAVTAYILNMADLLPEDFVLNQANIAEVQKTLPNRNGLSNQHGLWKIDAKPDVQNVACMRDCGALPAIRSTLPAGARNTHGNLALQNRSFGAVRGIDTDTRANAAANPAANPNAAASPARSQAALAQQYGCMACHHATQKLLGPSFAAIAAKYANDANNANNAADNTAQLADKLKRGGAGVWGELPMPPQSQVPPLDIGILLQWILSGAK
jgi:cytochrome c